MKRNRETVRQKVAARVKEDLQKLAHNGLLPSLTELADQYKVSRPTMSKALQDLNREGLILMHRGRRIRVANAVEGGERDRFGTQQLPSSDRLYSELRSGIGNGTYEIGTPLPSVKYLVLTRHMSNHTVLKVYNRLIAEGLAHRKGKSVTVGSGRAVRVNSTGHNNPVILIVQRKYGAWKQLCLRQRDGEFGRRIVQEAERTGVRLVPAILGENSGRIIGDFRQVEKADDLPRVTESYGSNYWGSLVIDKADDIRDFSQVLDQLSQSPRPVAWFDSYDQGFPEKMSTRRNLVRCRFNERAAVACALDHLAQLGHKRCLWTTVSWQDTVEWQKHRLKLIREEAARNKKAMRVYSWATPTADEWVDFKHSRLPPLVSEIHQRGPSVAVKALNWFVAHNDELRRLWDKYVHPSWQDFSYAGFIAVTIACYVHDNDVGEKLHREQLKVISALALYGASLGKPPATALICPSDAIAVKACLLWLRHLKMSVPNDMSVVSFDNYLRFDFHPVNSVDFGFGRLGYQAFHALLDDIPVRRNRSGEIETIPHVVDRGSTKLEAELQHPA